MFQKCLGPDMFSWIRHYVVEVCARLSALLVLPVDPTSPICSVPIFPSRLQDSCLPPPQVIPHPHSRSSYSTPNYPHSKTLLSSRLLWFLPLSLSSSRLAVGLVLFCFITAFPFLFFLCFIQLVCSLFTPMFPFPSPLDLTLTSICF